MESQQTAETSVLFSLAELAEIEHERIREEERLRAAERAAQARERRRADEELRAREAARATAETAARANREREQAEARARMEAHKQAALDVAQIQAEAKVRLEADNAARAHELAVIGARTERRGRHLRHGLVAVLGLSLCVGSAVAYGLAGKVARLEQDNDQLRAAERSLVEARLEAHRAALAALERKYEALGSSPDASRLSEPRDLARRAHVAIDAERVDEPALGAFRDALDRWQTELEHARRLTLLDRRYADLLAWSTAARVEERVANTRAAASGAHAPAAGEAAIGRYERALDELRAALGRAAGARGLGGGPTKVGSERPSCTNPLDPLCGLDGKAL